MSLPGEKQDPKVRDKEHAITNEKAAIQRDASNSDLPAYDAREEDHFGEREVITDAKGLITHVLHVDDDPSLSPWTFRALFLGMIQSHPLCSPDSA
jgi:hypothetical protein